jgi:triacylglycerol lipase
MDKNEAILCAQVAQATYGGQPNIKDFRLTARFENKGTDTQGIFGEIGGNTLVIGFRGSEETGIWDWITDLKFIQQVYPYGEDKNSQVKVHYGFISAYKSVRDAVHNQVKSSPHRRVICTGHSLGGALATLCALDVQYNFPDRQVSCYTFGSPKVGNSFFKDSYNKRVPQTYRFVNSADTVPALPPGGFEHVGLLQQVGQAASVVGNLMDKVKNVVDDHFPHNYIKAVQEFFEK